MFNLYKSSYFLVFCHFGFETTTSTFSCIIDFDGATNLFKQVYSCTIVRGHGCQTTLLRLLEDWRNALEKNQYVAAVLMDLSKAFDCLPHDILLDKLSRTFDSDSKTEVSTLKSG
jgi:hypothetical protein